MLRHAALICLAAAATPAADPAYRIERSVIVTSPAEHHFTQSRGAIVPGAPGRPPRVIVTTQETRIGTHAYGDLFMLESVDLGVTWTQPVRIDSLRRTRVNPGDYDFVIGDVCPQWHAKTGLVLATGKTFGFRGGTKEDRGFERVSYAVYTPATGGWTGLNLLQMPGKDHEGRTILEPNAGCHQRVDLTDGDILLPIRYRKDPATRQYTTIVARCGFDGAKLTYRAHGSEFTVPRGRGLYEPSVAEFRGRYYLTMRADDSAYVARSDDGVNYGPMTEWMFDDGRPLGSYQTQQHWVSHAGGLYLVYTRRGAGNDHIFRHRAPLFIARIDPDKLRVLRATEQVLIPEAGVDLGNFGVVDISPREAWVITSEAELARAGREGPNRVLLAKIHFTSP